MKIDVAKIEDIPALCDLLKSLFTQEAEFDFDAKAQAIGLKRIIENDEIGYILVARDDNRVIAMVNILFTVSTALGSRVGILEDMIVSSKGRGSGTGSALLERAEELAKEKGCKRITLLTDHDNNGAQRFYRKHGFTLSPMVAFRKIIDR